MRIVSSRNPDFDPTWINFLRLDPVHPNRPIDRRMTKDREVFFLLGEAMTPLLILCVAYGERIYDCIASIFSDEIIPEDKFKAVTFYSVFRTKEYDSTRITAGDFLIDMVNLIKSIHPEIVEFMTLSPIPTLKENKIDSDPEHVLQYVLSGRDPVAKFHMGNGAIPYKVHLLADESQNRLNESYGAMINYNYTR